MFMWKVSSITPTAGDADCLDDLDRVTGRVGDVGLEAVERLDAEHHARIGGPRDRPVFSPATTASIRRARSRSSTGDGARPAKTSGAP